MRVLKPLAVAAVLAGTAASAHAATLYDDAGPTAEMSSPDSYAIAFEGGAGAGLATFDINGYLSLDGAYDGPYQDLFTFTVNGTDVYRAYFPLGGLGGASVVLAPSGATQSVTNNGLFGGGLASLSIPITLLEGLNTITFAYSGEAQGTGDEGWGLANITVTGAAAAITSPGAAPEPATWAMMLLGFLGMGSALRTRRRAAA